jgi:NMD protein affecting ribosome stability and mRNA decay
MPWPSSSMPVPAPVPCCLCGDPIDLPSEARHEDAVCTECFRLNFQGAAHYEQPTVGRPARRRQTLHQLDTQRWPLTHGVRWEGLT